MRQLRFNSFNSALLSGWTVTGLPPTQTFHTVRRFLFLVCRHVNTQRWTFTPCFSWRYQHPPVLRFRGLRGLPEPKPTHRRAPRTLSRDKQTRREQQGAAGNTYTLTVSGLSRLCASLDFMMKSPSMPLPPTSPIGRGILAAPNPSPAPPAPPAPPADDDAPAPAPAPPPSSVCSGRRAYAGTPSRAGRTTKCEISGARRVAVRLYI